MEALLRGTDLSIDAKTGCALLAAEGMTVALVWPHGFVFDGTSIVDAEGRVVAVVPSDLTVSGGFISRESDLTQGCADVATEVWAVNGIDPS